jgi:hypothetical protein
VLRAAGLLALTREVHDVADTGEHSGVGARPVSAHQAEIAALEKAAESEAQEARGLVDKLEITRTAYEVSKAQHGHVTNYLADLERIQAVAHCREDFYKVVERQSLILAARDFIKLHAFYLAPVEKEYRETEKRAKQLKVI